MKPFPATLAAAGDMRAPAAASGTCYAVRSLVRSHGSVRAVDGVDLDITAGEIFGLLGPNGAGKTTLVRSLVGLLRPDSGSVQLLGEPATRRRAGELVAYLPQADTALADLTVRDAVQTTARLRGASRSRSRQATEELLTELDLTPLASRVVARLSGGQRRLAGFAAALVADRPVLVLDEPTTGLDPQARRAVWQALTRRRDERGTSVVLVTHNVLEAETVLDRVALLDAGRVVAADTPGRLKARLGEELRLDLVWREAAPLHLPDVAALARQAETAGRRWRLRLEPVAARRLLADLLSGQALAHLDDFTLSTPTLEDVYLRLGGQADDLERS